MRRILLASSNPGKLAELQSLLGDLGVELVLPEHTGIRVAVEENGESYAENAALKALAYARQAGLVTIADDTGLEVETLGGLPGIRSKRFTQKPDSSDAERRAYLLELLRAFPRPWKARFCCTLALATPAGEVFFSEGECAGEIIPEERGEFGFGYDPIFYIPELGKTMAELAMEEKNRISHRARAVWQARPRLTELISRES